MSEKPANWFGYQVTPAATFIGVFITVFLLVFITDTAITFILPESFASTARIKVEPDMPAGNRQTAADDPDFIHTTCELIQSEMILKPVIEKLGLNDTWGKKYFNGEPLKPGEAMAILKQRLQLTPVKNTTLIAITAYSDDRNEAAQIANAVAGSYKVYRQNVHLDSAGQNLAVLANPPVVIVDTAEPGRAPVKPNKPLNIVLGGIFGFILASAAGGLCAFLAFATGRKWKKKAAAL
jgi:uncharacterized protein involved in exopolysaccharide biosynthesis